jgi:His/Glu/Gln/Arg/opine family amino acid ABC transporter permease subunit
VFHSATMDLLAAFDLSFISDYQDELWEAFKATMKAALLGIAGSFVIGLVGGAIRAHRIPVLNQIVLVYVELIRNTPILVQILFLWFGLPELGYTVDTFTVAWLSLMIWGGAFNTENFRAGFEAVPTRLREAGYALGFTRLKTFLNVTLPVGGRIALPSSINTFISVLKNTSLLTAIGYPELTNVATNIQAITFKTFEMFTVLAIIYLTIVWSLSALIRLLEARLALPERI